ncbi:DUF6804 family protein [Larkinella arboricola]
MTTYRIFLFLAAGLVLLTAIPSLSLPDTYYLVMRIIIPALALYSIFYYPDLKWTHIISLCLIAFLFNPLLLIKFPQPSGRIIALGTAADFIRLGFDLRSVSKEA